MNEPEKYLDLLKRSSLFIKENGTDEQAEMILRYIELLLKWNDKINLTGISNAEEMMNSLVLNSMCGLEFTPYSGTLLDIGTGAGIPGIILKIFRPELRVYLVEPKEKKSLFIKEVLRTLSLKRVAVLNAPFEVVCQPGNLSENSINTITIRALKPDEKIIAGAAKLLIKGGFFLLYSSISDREESLLGASGFKLYREMRDFSRKKPILYAYRLNN